MIPDVLGYKLEDAMPLLEKSNIKTTVIITKSAKGLPNGCKRVVNAEIDDFNNVVLTVVCEEKGGIHNAL
ncbi:hypothetical protein JCM14036_19960 [Desulfotomaculum defluvii]